MKEAKNWMEKFSDGQNYQLYGDVNQVWDFLVASELFTEAELELITCLNGFRLDVLNDCIFARYGYRSLQQMLEAEAEEE